MARTVTFNDFTGGDWGDSDATVAPRNRFKAKNMVVNRDGTICPRPGLREVTSSYTGLPTGEIKGYGFAPSNPLAIYFVIGTTVYTVPAVATGAAASWGSIAAAPEVFHLPQETNRVDIDTDTWLYLAFKGSGVYRRKLTGTTWERVLDDFDSAVDLTRSHERLYAAGQRGIRYTAVDDFTTWDENDTFDIGYTYTARCIVETGFGLYVFRQGDGLWYITGDPAAGVRPSNIYTEKSPGMNSVWYDRKGLAVWIPQERKAPIIVERQVVDDTSLDHLRSWCESDPGDEVAVAYASEYESLVFVHATDNKGLARISDVWVEFDFEVEISKCISRVQTSAFSLSDGGGAAATPKFYLWNPALQRPGFTTDTYARPGDGSDTPLDAELFLPELTIGGDESDLSGIVETVEVEFISWNSGTTETAHFDVTVRTWDPVGEGGVTGVRDAVAQSFDEAVTESATTGTRQRMSFEFGDQGRGRRHQIRLTNVRNVSIKEITVNIDDSQRVNC